METTKRKKSKTQRLVITAMLFAIMMIMGFVPSLGFIPIGVLALTLMTIPVIVGAQLEGPLVGTILSLTFGLTSLIQAYITPSTSSILFMNPLISVLPRLPIGICVWAVAKLFSRGNFMPKVGVAVAAAVGSAVNTVCVLAMIGIVYGSTYLEMLNRTSEAILPVLAGVALANGVPEAILATLVSTPIVLAVTAMRRRGRRTR